MRFTLAIIMSLLILSAAVLAQTKPAPKALPPAADSVRTVSVQDQIKAIEQQQLQTQTQHAQLEAIKQYLLQVRQDSLRVKQ